MLFTRTIRRKMVFGLTLVLVMLVTLSASGISGLVSYRNTVRGLERKIDQFPRRADLTDAVDGLFEPLLLTAAAYRGEAFRRQFDVSRRDVQEFRRKLDRLPPDPGVLARQQVASQLLTRVAARMNRLQQMSEGLDDDGRVEATTALMLRELGHLQILAHRVPDSQVGLKDTLSEARQSYHSRFVWVCGTSAVALVLFFSLVRYGYTGIFSPLCKLHQGASRVAQGDFDFRLELTTKDEMAELAESFNRMTDRFQEIAADLDSQVQQRSRQLVRSERLAGIGFLAAGVAHEINNPLSAIAMATESIRDRLEDVCGGAETENANIVREYLEMIHGEAFRCREITARLLDFARGQEEKRSENDLTNIVSEVLLMVRPMSRYRDRTIHFSRTTPSLAEVNGPEIKQVVLNLVANALEATGSGGELHIDITEQVDTVILTFQDDGCGMTPDVLEHLFDPFFTRRREGKGTGLGMAISHRIINDHHGTIEASSEGPGCGSTFRIYLPRRASQADAAA